MNAVIPNTAPVSAGNPTDAIRVVLKDIGAKWGKFSEQELGALKSKLGAFKSKDDLVTPAAAASAQAS